MADRKVRYMLESGAPFSVHGEGITIQAVTRKSEVPVTIEIEGVTRRLLLQFQAAIEQELARREAGWKQERQRVLKLHHDVHPEQPAEPVDQPTVVEPVNGDDHRPAA
jgi:hypothetical protein